MPQIVLPKHVDTVIASAGGVGSSMLLTHLANYRQTNLPSDGDGFKHSPLPPMTKNLQARFVYVFGDPRLATISLFRRCYQRGHSGKLQRYQAAPVGKVPHGMLLDEYAAAGIDRFEFETHFDNWFTTYQVQETLFIRYESLYDNLALLATFLELPKQALATFPEQRARQANLNQLTIKTRSQLESLYGEFATRLAALDDVIIKKRVSDQAMIAVYQSQPYQRALTQTVRRQEYP